MTDTNIIETAARALQDALGSTLLPVSRQQLSSIILTAVTPLIRAQVLEEAATRLLELAREERNLDGATINRAAEYLDALRALKADAPPPFAASA